MFLCAKIEQWKYNCNLVGHVFTEEEIKTL